MKILTHRLIELSTTTAATTAARSRTGTAITTPAHRFAEAPDLALTPLSLLADLPGTLIPAAGGLIDAARLDGHPLQGRAVLLHTGARTARLTAEAAGLLAARGAALVGTDAHDLDPAGPERPAEARLLLAGIPIVTGLRDLDALTPGEFRFHAPPPALAGAGTSPVRAYAVLGDA